MQNNEFITSYFISKYKEIYHILVNTKEKLDYQLNRLPIEGKFEISFYYDIEAQPGNFEEWEDVEYIDIPFNYRDYIFTSMQEKDQITIIAIPKKYFIGDKFFKKI